MSKCTSDIQLTMDVKEVKQKVCELEGAIKRLDSVRKHLNRNASEIKTEIHANVSHNLECLRGREVSLLDAVDQVLGLKEETLQSQQARLNQALGVLHTSLSVASGTDADSRQLADTLHRLNNVELSPEETPYIAFRADHLGLREAILSYGRVDANGLPLATAFEDPRKPSASLPRHLEEYEDAEHHIFYKTVSGQNPSSLGPMKSINVTIPKLSTRMEDWLLKKMPIGSSRIISAPVVSSPATRPSSLPQRIREGMSVSPSATPGSSCSLNNWLSLIKQHADLEEEHDFEITDNTNKLKGWPETSTPQKQSTDQGNFFQHIQKDPKSWLQPGNHGEASISRDVFKHISADTKVWLSQAYNQLKELSSSSRAEKTYDPFSHISKDNSMWLRSRAPSRSGGVPSVYKAMEQKSMRANVVPKGSQPDLFSHISKDLGRWLVKKDEPSKFWQKSESKLEKRPDTDTKGWLLSGKSEAPESTPKQTAHPFELEDVCRANELCCSMSECVSKPDCVTIYRCETIAPSSSSSPTKDKNHKNVTPTVVAAVNKFQHTASTKTEDWLSQSPSNTIFKREDKQSEKLFLDIEAVEKKEKTEEELPEKETSVTGNNKDLFHLIPSMNESVWLAQKVLPSEPSVPSQVPLSDRSREFKEENNLWLQKAQPLADQDGTSTDALFQEWLMLAKGKAVEAQSAELVSREKEDSEGWSIVSDTFSVQTEQQELDVATADSYINKWLM